MSDGWDDDVTTGPQLLRDALREAGIPLNEEGTPIEYGLARALARRPELLFWLENLGKRLPSRAVFAELERRREGGDIV